MLDVGIIGLGFMGQAHFAHCRASGLAQVVAVADCDPDRRNGHAPVAGNLDAGARLLDLEGIARYESGADLIARADVDVVYICVPTAAHAALAVQAARCGRHVFCEKPMARTLEDSAAMIESAQAAGVRLMVGHCLRFWPEFQYLKEAISSRRLGALRSLAMFRFGSAPRWSWHGWMLDGTQSGGALLDLHIHDVDAICWLLGAPRGVTAFGWNTVSSGEAIDWVETGYDYGLDLPVRATGGWLGLPTYTGFEYGYEAHFAGGWIRCHSDWSSRVVEYPDDSVEPIRPPLEGDAYANEDRFFLRCLAEGSDPAAVISPQDARLSLALALREEQAIRSGRATLPFG